MSYVGVIDSSVYQLATGRQSGPTGDISATITLGSHNLDLARAGRLGVRGVIHRATNGRAVDPSYLIVAQNARANGLAVSAYSYLRPNEAGTAEDHADLFVAAVKAAGVPVGFPPMADVEDFHGMEAWRGQRYYSWLSDWLVRVEQGLGRRPVIYSYRWLWTHLLGSYADAFRDYECVIAAYPHQPNAATQQHLWQRPPVDAGNWYEWATSTVTLTDGTPDDGYPTGPDPLPGWDTWSMWQIGSFGRARDYGFDAGSNIDINVVPAAVWARWTGAGPVPTPSPFPLPQPAPVPAPPEEGDTVNLDLLVPWGYQTGQRSLRDVERTLAAKYHPEYLRRLMAWLSAQGGHIGIGGHWRATGTQPDKPGFAPEGKSFHQDQRYADGFVGACAVDLVARNGSKIHRSPNWSEVPAQGSKDAAKWGVHCNIGSEAWHMQPVEIDGHASWLAAGRPFPRKDYPIPGVPAAPAPPAPTPDRYVTAEALELVPNANAQSGWPVLLLQIGLNAYRFQRGESQLVTDGVFGILTIAAVQEFQKAKGLTPDGIVGSKTYTSFLTGKVWS